MHGIDKMCRPPVTGKAVGIAGGVAMSIQWKPRLPNPHPATKPQCLVSEILSIWRSCSSRTWM